MDIAAWLDSLGLGQYGQAFLDNDIEERVLPSLTAEDLKDLGVMLVGHRRRLLDAIAALGTSTNVAAAATAGTGDVAWFRNLDLLDTLPIRCLQYPSRGARVAPNMGEVKIGT